MFGNVGFFPYLCIMNFNSRTYVNTLKPRQIQDVCDKVLNWCVSVRGYKKNKGVPTLRISLAKKESENTYGYYCPYLNEIVLYKETLKEYTVRKLIAVIIHEYTHSLQTIKKSYESLYKKYGYWNHPMEVDARDSEKLWNLCYKTINL